MHLNKGGKMWQYNYTNNNDYIAHFGTRGMKWGYYDGKRNGKRTARSDEYAKDMIKNATEDWYHMYNVNDSSDPKTKVTEYYKSKGSKNRANMYNSMKKDASGIGYNLGFSVGRVTKYAKSGAKSFKKFASKTYNSIKNKVSSGLAWVKKNLFGHKHSATHNPKH